MVEKFNRTTLMKTFGATPYGGDLNKWPAKLVDAFTLMRIEEMKVESFMRNAARVRQPPQGGKGHR